jgi:hypothetical protein
VHLLAHKSRNLRRIGGPVREDSADRLEDPAPEQTYYFARVAVDRDALPPGIMLSKGMPAEVMIGAGAPTLLDDLTRPIADTRRRGMRES